MKKIPLGANKQIDPDTFAITPYVAGGLMNAAKLEKIAEVAATFLVHLLRFETSGLLALMTAIILL